MMTKTLTTKSPLGDAQTLYKEKSQKNGNILDHTDYEYIELYPAGYTKPSRIDGGNRQDVYKEMFNLAVVAEKEMEQFPFGKDGYEIMLLPERDNQFDKNAVRLVLSVMDKTHPLANLHGRELGYIPMKISKFFGKTNSKVTCAKILKVRSEVHGKYYNAKIAIGYGDNYFVKATKKSLKRFEYILDE